MHLKNINGVEPINVEEYVFHMIVQQKQLFSSTEETYTECIEFSNKAYAFKISILEASRILDIWPDFLTGLVGSWKLSTNGYLSLIKVFESKDPNQIEKFLQDKASHELLRQHYTIRTVPESNVFSVNNPL
jgi:hypothetical protein